jgi:hypothetical protein
VCNSGRSPPGALGSAETCPGVPVYGLLGKHHTFVDAADVTSSVNTLKLDTGGHDCNVRCIATFCHQDPSYARRVVASIECIPATPEIGFLPGTEVHGRWIPRHPDVTQIARAVARRDVHAAAKSDGKMGEVPTHAEPLSVGIPRSFGWAGMLVTERNAIVNEVADRLYKRPPLGDLPKQGPSDF